MGNQFMKIGQFLPRDEEWGEQTKKIKGHRCGPSGLWLLSLQADGVDGRSPSWLYGYEHPQIKLMEQQCPHFQMGN